MVITVHQPEFLPYIGFFERLLASDVFVVLDDVGYQKNGFINRNKIKTKDGWQWLTVPVKGRSPNLKINEVLIDNTKNWQESQLDRIKINYRQSPYFKDYFDFLQDTFGKKWELVSDLDVYLIENIVKFLGKKIKIERISLMDINGSKTERLLNICKKLGADTYISGPGGKNYMNMHLFDGSNIKVVFQEFSNLQYQQLFENQGFIPYMSIIDLLFNCGRNFLKEKNQ